MGEGGRLLWGEMIMGKVANTGFVKLIAAVMACVMALACLIPSTAWADDVKDVSFSSISTMASSQFQSALAKNELDTKYPGEDSSSMLWQPGDDSGLIGFVDPDNADIEMLGFTINLFSQAAASISSDAFMAMDNAYATNHHPFQSYSRYGYLLGLMGFDSVASGMSFLNDILRSLLGSIMFVCYMFASLTSHAMGLTIGLIQAFNPFALFNNAIGEYQVGGQIWENSAVMGTFSSMYKTLQSLGFEVLVPLFMIGLVFTWGLWMVARARGKQADAGSVSHKAKQLVIRVAFIALGIPLLGTLYTSALDAMAAEMDGTNMNADTVIASNFVDFESWAINNQLAVPDGMEFKLEPDQRDGVGGNASGETLGRIREYAFAINQKAGLYNTLHGFAGGLADGYTWDTDERDPATNGDNSDLTSMSTRLASFNTSLNMLMRFIGNDTVLASNFESTAKMRAQNDLEAASDFNREDLVVYLEGMTKAENYKGGLFQPKDDKVKQLDGYLNWFMDGNLGANGSPSTGYTYFHQNGKGLSTIGMYNYLNSQFVNNSVQVHSADKAVIDTGVLRHYSVNSVGTGFYGFVLWANAVLMLIAFSIIAIAYIFGMLINNFKHGISLLLSLPFGVLGVIPSIVKVVSLTAIMAVEILVSFFAYAFMCDMLLLVNDYVSTKIPAMLAGGGTSQNLVVLFGSYVFMIIVLIIFIIMALRVRKAMTKAVNETVEGIVSRVIGAEPTNSGMNPAMAAGLGAAAGNVAGGYMAAKRFGGNNGAEAASGTAPGVAAVAAGGKAGGADAASSSDSSESSETKELSAGTTQGVEGADQQGVGPDAGAGGADAPASPDAVPSDGGDAAGGGNGTAAVRVDANASKGDAAAATKANRAIGATSVSQDDADAEAKSQRRRTAAVQTGVHAAKAVAHGAGGDVVGAVSEGAQGVQAAQKGATAGRDVDAARARQTSASAGAPARTQGQNASAQRMSQVQQQGRQAQAPRKSAPAGVSPVPRTGGKQLTPTSDAPIESVPEAPQAAPKTVHKSIKPDVGDL